MKVLVIGATGLIGEKFYEKFSNISGTRIKGTYLTQKKNDLEQLDIRDTKKLRKIFNDFIPDIVIQPAAISNVEFCEENPEASEEVNIIATKESVNLCRQIKSKFVFFSTDYLFDGKAGPYSEDDVPNPLNVYGRQKLAMENFIRENLDDYLIIRTTVVYSWETKGKNFVTNLIKRLTAGDKLKVPVDQIGNPTYAENLADVVTKLIQRNNIGIYNVVGEVLMDRYSLGKMVCEVFELDANMLVPVETKSLGQKAKRPLKSGLKIDKVKKVINTKLIGPKEGLEMMFDKKDSVKELYNL